MRIVCAAIGSMQTASIRATVRVLDLNRRRLARHARVTIRVIGHTDRTPISTRNRVCFPDNYVLSGARARSRGR